MPSVFTRIIRREIPARIFLETQTIIVIADHHPKDVVHLLIIPKTEYPSFYETPPEVMADMLETAKVVADRLKIANHFRLAINNGYGQEVGHVHIHFLSNRGADSLRYI